MRVPHDQICNFAASRINRSLRSGGAVAPAGGQPFSASWASRKSRNTETRFEFLSSSG